MLARTHRLSQARDIAKVYKTGTYGSASGLLSAKAIKSGRTDSRAVVVVGKKVHKRAVVRNRIRRRLVNILIDHWKTVTPGYDIVVSVHTDISKLPREELTSHTIKALSRAGVIVT